jgi:protein SCO1/2
MMNKLNDRWILVATAMLLAAVTAHVQPNLEAPPTDNSNQVVNQIGIDQKLNAQVPLDLTFRDEAGRSVRLSEYVHDKPVILVLAYYRCPMLCSAVLGGVVKALRLVDLEIGKDYEVVTGSIDPKETPDLAAAKKATYVKEFGKPEAAAGWHFMVGDEDQIKTLAQTVGFRYVYDANTGQYAHAGGIMMLTPKGRVARYFYGVDFLPDDVRLGLVESSGDKIGSPVDQVLLLCYHYDPVTGKYGLIITRVLQGAAIATIGAFGLFWYYTIRRDRRKRAEAEIGASGAA